MKRLLLFISAFCFCGCAAFQPEVAMFGAAAYPPKAEDAAVEVYVTAKPSREYVEFAQIKCATRDDNACLEQIRKKAREIGADAVIIVGKARFESSERTGVNDVKYTTNEDYGMIAIAIKYK